MKTYLFIPNYIVIFKEKMGSYILKKRKLLRLYNSLEKGEKTQLKWFLESPYHGRQKELKTLCKMVHDLSLFFNSNFCSISEIELLQKWATMPDLFRFFQSVGKGRWETIYFRLPPVKKSAVEILKETILQEVVTERHRKKTRQLTAREVSIVYDVLMMQGGIDYFSNLSITKGQNMLQKMEPEQLYQSLYGTPGNNKKNWRRKLENTLSDLVLKIESFLAINAFLKDKLQLQRYYHQNIVEKNDHYLRKISLSNWQKLLKKSKAGSNKYENLPHYSRAKIELTILEDHAINKNLFHQSNLDNRQNQLFNELRQSLNYLLSSRVKNQEVNRDEFIPLLQKTAINKNNPEDHILIVLYGRLLNLLLYPKQENFLSVREMVDSMFREISRSDLGEVLSYLSNYCIQQYLKNNAQEENLANQIALYKFGIKNKVLISNEYNLPANVFLNIIISLSINKKFEDIPDLIMALSPNIDIQERQSALSLANGFYYFHLAISLNPINRRKASALFEKTDSLLKDVKNRGFVYSIRLQSLSLRVAYELYLSHGEHKRLINRINSYQSFFARNTYHLPKEKLQDYRNLGWYVNKLYEFDTAEKRTANAFEELGLLTEAKNCIALTWVKQKIEEQISRSRSLPDSRH